MQVTGSNMKKYKYKIIYIRLYLFIYSGSRNHTLMLYLHVISDATQRSDRNRDILIIV